MRGLLALMLSAMLAGCVTTPELKPSQQQLKGEVHFPQALPRSATVEVAVLSVIGGRPLQVAATRYEVTMLPLLFDLRLTPLQLAEGEIYLRARLRFMDGTAVQAMSQQKVFKIFNDKKMVIQLQQKACYPQCQ
ncbi:TPA: YscW family type III secretion system pilotin [Aeromonas salmonicida]|uniref:YscW family type III secretion system pilotin n=1 Tax=Aeromonas salmonicida TaxID=645 RepID=UPI00044668EC|nr:YscW family type III secretion system pilotin [Aeromonas salmonicida]ASI21584.1 type III secretion system chaperone YscW [Aeromonas salmonicida]ASI25877.1 type III secretion system chaperone YscW [Aeromonas salmonicida]ASI29975.1 type III secretion system chaperone YscW [Aeromonas salmonicida]ATD40618.1 type III secretion system chaperone YscW [Aeromonas salmonicida subsp. masoucida]ELI6406011.1 YscW family type III secretion system pilotin [Aeromonas salmonicida subsp. salmonicida]